MANMDKAITDILFVSSPESKPLGYTIIKNTYGGHSAQLFQAGFGMNKELTSYLCFTRKTSTYPDLVVEDVYMHMNKKQPVRKGYELLKATLDGNKSMRHVKLAIKKVQRHKAKSIIQDIGIYLSRDKDMIPDDYLILPKVNNLRIAIYLIPCAQSMESFEAHVMSLVEARGTVPSGTRRKKSILHRLKFNAKLPQLKQKSSEDMVTPITDIAIVGSLDNVPKDYTAIETCVSGHSAQLWFTVVGGLPRTRYLCYTKKKQADKQMIENLLILGGAERRLVNLDDAYSIIKETVEGEEPLKWKELAVLKTPTTKARRGLVDIKLFHTSDTDSIPENYTALNWSINNIIICFLSVEHDFSAKKKKKYYVV